MGWGKRSFLGFCLAWFYLFWCMLILGRAFIPCPDKAVAAPRGCPEITLCDVSAIAFLSQGCILMEIVTGAVQENLLTVLPISWQEMGLSLTSAVVAPVLCLHRGLVEPLMPMLWDQLSQGNGCCSPGAVLGTQGLSGHLPVAMWESPGQQKWVLCRWEEK